MLCPTARVGMRQLGGRRPLRRPARKNLISQALLHPLVLLAILVTVWSISEPQSLTSKLVSTKEKQFVNITNDTEEIRGPNRGDIFKIGMDVHHSGYDLQLNFDVKFKNAEAGCNLTRCLANELSEQLRDPASPLHWQLKTGRTTKLLSQRGFSGFGAPDPELPAIPKREERKIPTASSLLRMYEITPSQQRRLLQADITADTRSTELVLLQIAVLLGVRQVSFSTLATTLDLLTSVQFAAHAAASDLTPRHRLEG
eukprot:2220432-Rhodomonas_salina.3